MRKLGLIASLLLGCATQAPGVHRPAPVTAPTDPEPIDELQVQCTGNLPCPAFVGVMIPDASVYDEQCTGTLIGPERFLTAGHCLHPSVRSAGADCQGHRIYFPSDEGVAPESAQCDEVLAIALSPTDSITGPDFAIVSLTPSTQRTSASILRQPPEPDDQVQIWGLLRMTPDRFEIRHQSCLAMNPERAAAHLGPSANEATWLERCSIFPGHSGAPVLDTDGRLRGLIHAGSELFFAIGVMTRLPEAIITVQAGAPPTAEHP